jgi:hypothetical protein
MIRFTGMAGRACIAVMLCLLLCASFASEAVRAGDVKAKNNAVAAPESNALLSKDEELAHPIVKGSIGPWKNASVVLTNVADPTKFQFKGRVVVQHAGRTDVYPLPIPEDIGLVMEQHAKAVMFRNIDKSSQKAAIILYEFHRSGSASDDGYGVYVFRWDGQRFVSDDQVREKLFGARNSKEIDRRLASVRGKQ